MHVQAQALRSPHDSMCLYNHRMRPDVQCRCSGEGMNILWGELGLNERGELTAESWEKFMVQFIRRQAERDANMFVVVPSTPAQFFHMLRRQANLPYQRPLVVAAPKFLHHHRPATSALHDLTTGVPRSCTFWGTRLLVVGSQTPCWLTNALPRLLSRTGSQLGPSFKSPPVLPHSWLLRRGEQNAYV
jgi:hypothetical protein